METMFRMRPRPWEDILPRGRRIGRSLRNRWNMLASNTFRDGMYRSR